MQKKKESASDARDENERERALVELDRDRSLRMVDMPAERTYSKLNFGKPSA